MSKKKKKKKDKCVGCELALACVTGQGEVIRGPCMACGRIFYYLSDKSISLQGVETTTLDGREVKFMESATAEVPEFVVSRPPRCMADLVECTVTKEKAMVCMSCRKKWERKKKGV